MPLKQVDGAWRVMCLNGHGPDSIEKYEHMAVPETKLLKGSFGIALDLRACICKVCGYTEFYSIPHESTRVDSSR